MSKCRKIISIDIETENYVEELFDMNSRNCSCGKGYFKEMYLQDDWRGVLHCTMCNKETKRFIPVNEYREIQINKILNE